MRCVPCRGGEPGLTDDQIAEFLPQIPNWGLIDKDGIQQLARQYKFKDFAQAMAFSNQIGTLADAEDHHPAILIEWGQVTVTWWTHVLNGLHLNDFILAAKTDRIFEANKGS